MTHEFYARAAELSARGEAFVAATVVRAERPTSAKPGDKALITADGALHGWVGGSCTQPAVLAEARRALADGQARLIRLSAAPEAQAPRAGLTDLPMSCFSGGTVEIYLEPQLPTPRLLVVGGGPIARALVGLGLQLGYEVLSADMERAPGAVAEGARAVADLAKLPGLITPATYVVVASHGAYDEIALGYALRARAAYVALVASPTRAQAVRELLAGEDLPPEALAALKAPAGLDLGAAGPGEVAVSILAEIIQRRHALAAQPPAEAPAQAPPALAEPIEQIEALEAIDPICGMSVTIAGARHTYVHEGQVYYFCCAGCRSTFRKNPGEFVGAVMVGGGG